MRHAVLFSVLFLAGCSAFQEHQEQRTVQETSKIIASHERDVNERYLPTVVETETDPKTGITKTKVSPPAEIHTADSVNVNANQKSFWDDMSAYSYPFFVKLIGLALGLFLLGLLVWAWRKQSAAVDQAYQLADEALARQIRKRRERAQESTDPMEVTHHSVSIADLEAERGKLRAKKK